MDYYTVLTDAGRALEAAALAGNKTYTLAICALGDGDGLPDPTRTRLQNEVWRGPINTLAPDVNNPTWLLIETHVPPESGGFTIREFGIYTDDGILFAIGNHPEIYKPTLEEGTGIDLIVRPICAVSNATSVTLLTDPTVVMASKKYVDDRIAYSDADLRATLVPSVRTIATAAPLMGGGMLSDDLTIEINEATETALGVVERATDAEASAGTDVTRYVTPKHLASAMGTIVPFIRGMIMMWSGTAVTIPVGWALCNGQNGTPNLLDRFVVGAGNAYAPGTTGGAETATTTTNGAHGHNITVGVTTLVEWQMPSHAHYVVPGFYGTGGGGSSTVASITAQNGALYTGYTGSNGGHNHTATADSQGNHAHTVATLPPYYALCFIMKL